MTPDLSAYQSVQSNLLIKIEVEYYKADPEDTATSTTLAFSDRLGTYTYDGVTYVGLGSLMSVTSSASELRTSSGDVTITISGIPNSSIAEIVNSRIKGSPVTITRYISDSDYGWPLVSVSGRHINRFSGYVNNLALDEDYDSESRTSTNTLVLSCSSVVDIMSNKISGRKTNPASMKKFYSTDLSMDRVPTLENSYFDFGAKK